MSKSLAERAWDLSYSQLRAQKEDLKYLRNQASFCAAVSGLIASVFANLVRSNPQYVFGDSPDGFLGFSLCEVLVIGLFTGSIAFSVVAVIGWKTCNFDMNSATILHAKDHQRDEDNLFSQLSSDAQEYFVENEKVLDDAKEKLRWSLILAWAQIPAWLTLLS